LIWQSLACTAACGNHRHLPPDEVSGERGQLVVLPPCPSVFDQNASPFDEALFGCRARAASGHATAAPPMSVMNSLAPVQLIESHSVPSSQGAFQDIELAANS
jgi:hypothetical protein